jgi:hypothetical protein
MSGPEPIIEKGMGLHGVIGKVTGSTVLSPSRLRQVRVFSEDICCTIAPLSDYGTFSFGGAEAGDFIRFLLSDRRILFEGRIRIESTEEFINVDLAQARATIQPR